MNTKAINAVTACALALVGCSSAHTRGYSGDIVAAYGIVQCEDWHDGINNLKVKRLTYADGSLVSVADAPDVREKDAAKLCGCLVSPLAFGTNSAALVTTNLVVFTDLHTPKGTSHLHGTRTVLTIRDGLVTDCRSEGVYDLFLGLPEADARRKRDADRADAAKRREEIRAKTGELRRKIVEVRRKTKEVKRKTEELKGKRSQTNAVDCVTH